MKAIAPATILLFFLLFAATNLWPAQPGRDQRVPRAQLAANAGQNPLIIEMDVLDNVIREVVSAIAQSDGARVAKAVDTLRGPAEKAQQALRAGAVSLPKNGNRLDDFQRHYDSVHVQIDALSRAGQRNDIEAMLMITKQLLESCVTCHRTFRP